MKFRLDSLSIRLKRETEVIPFAELSYFYGQMGSGKTSIARLVDYCLGGIFSSRRPLQSEFVAAVLSLDLNETKLTLERPRDSAKVIGKWEGPAGGIG